jgi:hypothetical protein
MEHETKELTSSESLNFYIENTNNLIEDTLLRLFKFLKSTQKYECDNDCNGYDKSCYKCTDIYYVNLKKINQLCEKGNLKDAYIFKTLFGLIESPFKKNNKLFNFRTFHITYKQWSDFISFVSNEKFITYIAKEGFRLNQLIETCNKLGGIPYFNIKFKELTINNNKKKHIKNHYVLKPKDDINNIFIWKAIPNHHLHEFQTNLNFKDFTATGYWEEVNSITKLYYFKKIKNNDDNDN